MNKFENLKAVKQNPKKTKSFLKVIIPSGLQGLVINGQILIIVFVISLYLNKDAFNGAAIATSLFSVALFMFYSFNQSGDIYIGQMSGAKKYKDNIYQVVLIKILMNYLFFLLWIIVIYSIEVDRVIGFLVNVLQRSKTTNINVTRLIHYGNSYLKYLLISNVFLIISIALSSTLRVDNHPFVPLIASLISLFSAIIFGILLVGGFTSKINYGIDGLGWAIVITRIANLIILISYIYWKKLHWMPTLKFWHWKISWWLFKKQTYTAMLIMISDIAYPCLNILIEYIVAKTKNYDLFTITNLIIIISELAFSFLLGLYAVGPMFVGRYLGIGEFQTAKENAKIILGIGFYICLGMAAFILTFLFWAPYLIKGLDVRSLLYLRWAIGGMSIGIPIYALGVQYLIILRTAGHSVYASLVEEPINFLVYIPLLFILLFFTNIPKQYVLFIMPLTYSIIYILAYIKYRRIKWNKSLLPSK